MIVLGIDTATTRVSCALGGAEGVLASTSVTRGPRHAETLAPSIEFVCEQAGMSLGQVGVVAVDVGPGLFTGLRVGLAAAKALAHALRVPMLGLSSLDLVAFGVRHSPRLVVAMIDARRGEVYTAQYRHVPGGVQRVSPPAVVAPDAVASDLEATGAEALLVGDGAIRYAELFSSNERVEIGGPGSAHPDAAALVELAHPKAVREEFVTVAELEPLYLRRSDAEINWDRRVAERASTGTEERSA